MIENKQLKEIRRIQIGDGMISVTLRATSPDDFRTFVCDVPETYSDHEIEAAALLEWQRRLDEIHNQHQASLDRWRNTI